MKKLLVAGAALAALMGAPALAADMALKAAPPPAPPPCVWCGWYIGANAGYTWGNNSVNAVGAPSFNAGGLGPLAVESALVALGTNNLPANNRGFIGGVQIGYNYQLSSNFVGGIETDIQGVASKHTGTVAAFTSLAPGGFPAESYTSTASATNKLNYLGTFRGRLGVTVTPAVLAYATGGLAYGGVSSNTSIAATESLGNPPYPPVAGSSGYSGTRAGWTAGGGLEWMLGGKWSAKAEYLYYDLGKVSSSLTLTQIDAAAGGIPWGAAVVTSTTRFNGNIVRVGLNYKL